MSKYIYFTILTNIDSYSINYMDNEARILSEDPVRQDTMMFKKASGES